MKAIALALIRAYQRWISPRKGFACAHRVHRGGASCSQAGFRLIRRHGLGAGWPLLRERLRRCSQIAAAARALAPGRLRPLAGQRGDCDLPLPDCDLPSPRGAASCAADACCSGCDWPRREQRPPRERRRR